MRNSSALPERRSRVVLATTTDLRDRILLDMAVNLAVSRSAELLALFVEDINLLNMSDLPFTMEVDCSSASLRKLDAKRVGRSLRAQTKSLHTALSQLATAQSLSSSVRVVRGHFLREALAAADQADVLILGAARTIAHKPGAEAASGPRGPVAVLYAGAEEDTAALRLAMEVTRARRSSLIVLCTANADDAAVISDLERLGGDLPYKIRQLDSRSQSSRIARGLGARLLILSRSHAPEAETIVKDFLSQTDRAVVLVP